MGPTPAVPMTDSAFDPDRIDAVTFDSYGTLVDTASAARALEGVVDAPAATARAWRRNALFYSMVAGYIDEYRTYSELHLDGLRDALGAAGVDLPEERLRELNAVYRDLAPFDDGARGFECLHDAGYAPSILSNGDPEWLDSLVDATGVEPFVAETVSADEIRTLKPSRALYDPAATRVGAPAERIAHVTAHWMDAQGAIHAGMQGVWLDRGGDGWPSFGPRPSLAVDSIDALCDRLGA